MLTHFTLLDDVLAVGSHPHTPEQIEWLATEQAVRAVVNLQSDADLADRALEWSMLWQLYTRRRVSTVRVPITDFDRKDLQRNLEAAVAAIAKSAEAGKRTYVHCNAGMNRSPTAVIAYLSLHRGLAVEEAAAWVGERHACVPYAEVVTAWLDRR